MSGSEGSLASSIARKKVRFWLLTSQQEKFSKPTKLVKFAAKLRISLINSTLRIGQLLLFCCCPACLLTSLFLFGSQGVFLCLREIGTECENVWWVSGWDVLVRERKRERKIFGPSIKRTSILISTQISILMIAATVELNSNFKVLSTSVS